MPMPALTRPLALAHALAFSALLALATPAFAQPGNGTATATPAAAAPAPVATPSPTRVLPPGFQPVPGGEARAEAVDANLLVVLAYAGFFVAMFGYVIYVVRRQAAVSRELAELSARLEKRP